MDFALLKHISPWYKILLEAYVKWSVRNQIYVVQGPLLTTTVVFHQQISFTRIILLNPSTHLPAYRRNGNYNCHSCVEMDQTQLFTCGRNYVTVTRIISSLKNHAKFSDIYFCNCCRDGFDLFLKDCVKTILFIWLKYYEVLKM